MTHPMRQSCSSFALGLALTVLFGGGAGCTFNDSLLDQFKPCQGNGDCPSGRCVDSVCEPLDAGTDRPLDVPIDPDGDGGLDGDLAGERPPTDRRVDGQPGDGGSCSGQTCGSNQMCCNNRCVDVLDSVDNCGFCGNTCDGPNKCCNGFCRSIQDDEMNCGDCGVPCSSGSPQCCQGQCVPTGDDLCMCGQNCGADEMCCDGTCLNITDDPLHCGACETSCTEEQLCCDSGCVDRGPTRCTACDDVCDAKTPDCCPDGCTETQTDPLNCGECGNPCGKNERCCAGTCTPIDTDNCLDCGDACQAGEDCCSVIGCTDTQAADTNNCGGCGIECGPGQGCCDGACKSIQTDSDFCGATCRRCTLATHCEGGSCIL